jgi:uncharacterized protein YbbC (DUF1343 family)/CubicO group peptidase (beta-lactamase class C family)
MVKRGKQGKKADIVAMFSRGSKFYFFFAVLFLSGLSLLTAAGPYALPIKSPEALNFDPRLTEWIDAVADEMMENEETSGVVIAVGRRSGIAYMKAFGDRQVEPERLPMELDTVFDMASITKCVATATSMALLYDQNKYALDDPIARFMPAFAQNGKEDVTVRSCLKHMSGINPVWFPNYRAGSVDEIWDRVMAEPLLKPTGTTYRYICQGFLILGKLVEVLSGEKLGDFAEENIYRPLGMFDSGFRPKDKLDEASEDQKASAADWFDRCVTTEFDEKRGWIKGVVHDPQSWAIGGHGGNAGLFTTAPDLAVFASMMLGEGTLTKESGQKVRVLSPDTCHLWTARWQVAGGVHGLGWEKRRSAGTAARSWNYSPSAFGHTGFTGTAFWIDPDHDLFVILLGNRLHPKKRDNAMNRHAATIGTIAVDAICDPFNAKAVHAEAMRHVLSVPKSAYPRKITLNGIDALEYTGFELLRDRRVGLITNHTGIDRSGVSTGLLMKQAGVDLVALFSPEHGIAGKLEQSNIDDSRDPETGVPVYSLYGEIRRPTPEMLEGIDTLVFDIQDIGARFYTYISTMGMAMQAAADNGLDFVVLDRVNPISGLQTAGPLADPGEESFINFDRIPVRHGMTVGEIALMINDKQKLRLNLTVVPVLNWTREIYFDQTGLPWVNPSPNMRSLTAATLYPGVCLAEGTGYSVGRGTDTPFELIGAEWIDGPALAEKMNALVAEEGRTTAEKPIAGVRFEPITYTPTARPFQDKEISGIRFILTDRNALEPVKMGLALMRELMASYPDKINDRNANHLLLNKEILTLMKEGASLDVAESVWKEDFDRFMKYREAFLIYK